MTNEPYKVTVFTPVYNVQNYIERCARSLFEQTYSNLEYIFVDDCTPDKSIDLLLRVVKDYPNRKAQVRIIHNEQRRGIAAVRNSTVDLASGTFVLNVDSDDWIEKEAIEKLVGKQMATNADIVSSDAITEGADEQRRLFTPDISAPHSMIQTLLTPKHSLQLWGRLIRTALYSQIEGARDGIDYGEDTVILTQLIYYSRKLANVHEFLYHYFLGNQNALTRLKHKDKHSEKTRRARLQWVENCILTREFFRGKDDELEKQANMHLAYCIWNALKHCARRDKKTFYDVLSYKKYLEGNPFLSLAGKWGRLGVFWRTHYYCISFIR